MPITKLQSDILRLIAAKRDAESFIAIGSFSVEVASPFDAENVSTRSGVPINRVGPRYSADIYVFHDRQERVAEAALADAAVWGPLGMTSSGSDRSPRTYSGSVRLGADETKLEWVAGSDYRFFPTVKDDQFATCYMSLILPSKR